MGPLLKRRQRRQRMGTTTGGEPLQRVPKELVYSFQRKDGQDIGLNRRLPGITQRDVLASRRFE
jgi:hypothetical protein